AVAGLANVGLTGTLAGTGLSRVLLELSSSTSKVSRHLQDFEGDADDLVGMLQNLKADGLSVQEIYDDFGQIAGKSALALIDNADAIEALDNKMRINLDTLDKMKGKMEKGVNYELKILKSSFADVKISLGKAFGPDAVALIKGTAKALNGVNEKVSRFAKIWRNDPLIENWLGDEKKLDRITRRVGVINDLIAGGNKDAAKMQIKTLEQLTGYEVLNKRRVLKGKEELILKEDLFGTTQSLKNLEATLGEIKAENAVKAAKEAKEATEKEKALERQAEIEKKMQAERKASSASVGKLKDSPEFGPSLDGFEKYNQEKQSLLVDNHLSTIQKNADFYDHQQEQLSKDAERQLEIERDRAAQMEEIRQDEIENTRRAEEQKAEIRDNFTEAAFSLLDTYTSARISSIDREAQAEIKAVKNKNKVLTKEDKQIAKIEEDAANRAYKYRIAEHVGNITQAANNGFLAVTNTLANVPAPLNVPASIAVGAVATANVASIASNPP
ncbi:MAG: phage tail tape measure protein, partial [Planctomycetes bacterium]|nr:phage tail tape measure protein [Planctomycetota bacterium]